MMRESIISTGKWTDDEQKRFLDALLLYPKDWNQITKYVRMRIMCY